MQKRWYDWRGIDGRVLLALPLLAVLLGIANNFRVAEDRRVEWSGEHPKIEVEAEGAVRGRWTSDFVAATNAARVAHVPLVAVLLKPGCPHCERLHRAVLGREVKAWQKRLGWYFAMFPAEGAPPGAADFVKTTPVQGKMFPYVGVYWTRADGTRAMRNFTGMPKRMGVREEPSLAVEWMHAVEASVPGAPGVTFTPEQELGVQIAVKSEFDKSGRGTVKMTPQVKVLRSGQETVLTANPLSGSEFAGWRYPDGHIEDGEPRLTLDATCQAGVYRAVFRRRKGKDGNRQRRRPGVRNDAPDANGKVK